VRYLNARLCTRREGAKLGLPSLPGREEKERKRERKHERRGMEIIFYASVFLALGLRPNETQMELERRPAMHESGRRQWNCEIFSQRL
jgi:hypothetical protein